MKIGIDCRAYSWEGIGRYIKNLLINLFVIDYYNEYVLFFLPSDIDKFKCPNDNVRKKVIAAPHYSIKEQFIFNRVLEEEKLNLVHFTHFARPIFFQGKNVVTIHDLTHYYFPGKKMKAWYKKRAYHFVLRQAVKKADRIIAVSDNTKDDIVRLIGADKNKIDVVYEGVEPKFKPASQGEVAKIKAKYKIDKEYIIYVGVSRVHKNIQGLVKALAILINQYEKDLILVLGGKPHPENPELLDLIKKFNLGERILMPGFIPDAELPAFYSGAECFVFPSFYEGFGLPLLEAMACDVPIACSNTSSLPEIAGNAAVYFNPYDPSDMARAIAEVVSNKPLQKKLIKAGALQVGKFSWHKMARDTLAIYEKVGQR